MAGPWEDYAVAEPAPPAAPEAGPWQDYQKPPAQTPPPLSFFGGRLSTPIGAPTANLGAVMDAFGQGYREGFGPDRLGLSDENTKWLSEHKIFGPKEGGYDNPLQAAAELFANAAAGVGERAFRMMQGTFRGLAGASEQIGLPRDVSGIIGGEYIPSGGVPHAAPPTAAAMRLFGPQHPFGPIKGMPVILHEVPAEARIAPVAAEGVPKSIEAYHGSPHDFERFDFSKIGTGEGAQAYGHGGYFAQNEAVGRDYQKSLAGAARSTAENFAADALAASGGDIDKTIAGLRRAAKSDADLGLDPSPRLEAAKKLEDGWRPSEGNLYRVRINADPEHFLDWDKPLSEQPRVLEALKNAAPKSGVLSRLMLSHESILRDIATGKKQGGNIAYGALEEMLGEKGASDALREAGIPGIKYLDQGSRGEGEGTRNFVVFDDNSVEITHKNNVPVGPADIPDRNAISPALSEARELGVIGPPKPDVSKMLPAEAAATEVPRAQAAERTGDDVLRGPTPGEPEKAGNIRLDQIGINADAKDVILEAAKQNDDFNQARAGNVPLAQVESLSGASGVPSAVLSGNEGLGRLMHNDAVVRTWLQAFHQASDEIAAQLAKVKATGDEADIAALREMKIRFQHMQEQVSGLTAEAGRTLRVFRDFYESRGKAEGIGKLLEDNPGNDAESLKKLADAAGSLDPRTQLPKFLHDANKPTWWDKYLYYWVNALISGPVTHLKYIGANAAFGLYEAGVVTPIAGVLGAIRRAVSDQSGEMPSLFAKFGDTGRAAKNSSIEAPPGAQSLPDQVSTRPEPSGSSTTRPTTPLSTTEGPVTTFRDLELGAIDGSSNKKILQGSNNYKALLAAAERNKPKLSNALQRITQGIDGARVYGVRVKDEPGLVEKITTKGRAPSTISDYLGGRVVVDTPEAMNAILTRFEGTGAVIEAENFVKSPKAGYRAYHLQVGLGDGTSAEIQIVPRAIADKMAEMHAIRQPFKRMAEASPEGMARFKEAMERAVKISDDAWTNAKNWSEGGYSIRNIPGLQPGVYLDTGVYAGEAAARTWGLLAGTPDALKAAWTAARDNLMTPFPNEVAGKAVNPLTQVRPSAIGGKLGFAIGVPGRSAAGIHSFFRWLGYRAELEAQAYRNAAKEGLSPVADTEAFWQRYAWHAENPTDAAINAGIENGNHLTFIGEQGTFGRAVSQLANTRMGPGGMQPFKLILPFTHIPGQILRAGLEQTPFAIADTKMRADLLGKNGAVAADTARARLIAGGVVSAMVANWAINDTVTGYGPTEQNDRLRWLRTHEPYSVRVGGWWVSYNKFGPIGDLVGLVANLMDIGPKVKEEDYASAAGHVIFSTAHILEDEVGMQGLVNLIEALDDKEGSKMSRFVASQTATNLPYSSLLRQSASFQDPILREAKTFVDQLRYSTPWSRQDLLPKRDWLGEPMTNPGYHSILRQRAVNPDPIDIEVSQMRGIRPAPPLARINNVALPPKLYDEYQAFAGGMTRAALERMVTAPGWQDLPVFVREQAIHGTIEKMRQTAGAIMQMRHPEIVMQGIDDKTAKINGEKPTKLKD